MRFVCEKCNGWIDSEPIEDEVMQDHSYPEDCIKEMGEQIKRLTRIVDGLLIQRRRDIRWNGIKNYDTHL